MEKVKKYTKCNPTCQGCLRKGKTNAKLATMQVKHGKVYYDLCEKCYSHILISLEVTEQSEKEYAKCKARFNKFGRKV